MSLAFPYPGLGFQGLNSKIRPMSHEHIRQFRMVLQPPRFERDELCDGSVRNRKTIATRQPRRIQKAIHIFVFPIDSPAKRLARGLMA